MSLFDTLIYNNIEFQTKDLDSFLETYKIDEHGFLWKEEYDIVDKEEENFLGIIGFKKVNLRWGRLSYSGAINFYRHLKDSNTFEEYTAWFRDGQLKDIFKS